MVIILQLQPLQQDTPQLTREVDILATPDQLLIIEDQPIT